MDDLLGSGVKFALNVGVRVIANVLAPGSSAAIDFFQAAYDLSQGKKGDAAINTLSGVAELLTLGVSGSIKEAMKASAKKATGAAGAEIGKEGLHELIEEIFRAGTWKKFTDLWYKFGIYLTFSEGCRVMTDFLEELVKTMGENVFRELTKKNGLLLFNVGKATAKMAAEKEFRKQSYKLAAIEYGSWAVKGGIRGVTSSGREGWDSINFKTPFTNCETHFDWGYPF